MTRTSSSEEESSTSGSSTSGSALVPSGASLPAFFVPSESAASLDPDELPRACVWACCALRRAASPAREGVGVGAARGAAGAGVGARRAGAGGGAAAAGDFLEGRRRPPRARLTLAPAVGAARAAPDAKEEEEGEGAARLAAAQAWSLGKRCAGQKASRQWAHVMGTTSFVRHFGARHAFAQREEEEEGEGARCGWRTGQERER